MLRKTTMAFALCLMSAALFTNCAKEGPAGPAGTNGTNGKDGNANVKTSISSNVLWAYNAANQRYETVISNTAITADIINNGQVLVSCEITSGNWTQLPFTTMYDALTLLNFGFESFVGGIRVTVQNSDLDNSIVPNNNLRFKITALAGAARQAPSEPVLVTNASNLGTRVVRSE